MLWSLLLTSLIGSARLDVPAPCNPQNLTLNGTTSQSSLFVEGNLTFTSERAIDGNETECAQTKDLQNSWWRIDLLGVYNISSVMIYNIQQKNSTLTQIYIGNSRENNGTGNSMCMNITDYEPDAWNKYKCSTSLLGRYVTVLMPENGHLILCEVRICGTRQESPFELIKENKTWEEALNYCRSKKRGLASILDEETQAWAELEAERAEAAFVWLGLHYTCVLEFWFWVENHPLDFNRWANKTGECDTSVAMETQEDHLWFSKSDYERFNFICTRC